MHLTLFQQIIELLDARTQLLQPEVDGRDTVIRELIPAAIENLKSRLATSSGSQ